MKFIICITVHQLKSKHISTLVETTDQTCRITFFEFVHLLPVVSRGNRFHGVVVFCSEECAGWMSCFQVKCTKDYFYSLSWDEWRFVSTQKWVSHIVGFWSIDLMLLCGSRFLHYWFFLFCFFTFSWWSSSQNITVPVHSVCARERTRYEKVKPGL